MAAAAEEEFSLLGMNGAQLRQWVEANPGRVNDRDEDGFTPLFLAAIYIKSLPLTLWLLDEKGADVNATTSYGASPLHGACSLNILTALMYRGSDPAVVTVSGFPPLMTQSANWTAEVVARLLQDRRALATVNLQDSNGRTALHLACDNLDETAATSIVHLLFQAGGNPALTTNDGDMPLAFLRPRHPNYHAAIALLEQYPNAQKDVEKASLLVKARRLIIAANSNAVAPSYLQNRVARGQPLPRLALMPGTSDQNEDEEDEDRKLRTLMAFLLGMEGGWENAGMPRDVFRVVLDFFMPTWDPLRRKSAGSGPPVH